MARKRIVSNLHQLTVREVLAAGDGDHTDGGGLLLRVRGESASWVFRYSAAVNDWIAAQKPAAPKVAA